MKLLLDEDLPHELRPLLLPVHDVYTVTYMGWNETANGALLALAARNGFDAVLTVDRGYEHQQNLATLPCAVVLILARTTKIADLRPLITPLLTALTTLQPRSLTKIS